MTHVLQGANVTAQWFMPKYPGAEFFSHLEKFCLHTTETTSWPGYDDGAKAPNATYHPRLRQVRQHFDSDRSSRALQDPSDTAVRENRDNVFQLEIIAFSDYARARDIGGLWIGDLNDEHYQDIAKMLQQLYVDLGLPLESTVHWHEGQKTAFNDVRLNSAQYDSYKGILGHCHVSGNVHWDPGGFYISRLMTILEDGMDWNDPVVKNLDTGTVLEVDQALSYIYTRQARQDVILESLGTDLEALDSDLARVEGKVDALSLGTIDYNLLATKVVEKLAATTELGFRPST